MTPVLWAALYNKDTCLKALLEAGADVNIESNNQTALHKDALRGHVRCVDLLTKSGTDVNKGDLRKETALFYAVCNNHIQCADRIIAAADLVLVFCDNCF